MWQRILPFLLTLSFIGCAPQQGRRQAPTGSVEVQPWVARAAEAVVDVTPEVALERAQAALRARGFSLDALAGPAGSLEATSGGQANPDWADCPRVTVRDPFSEALRSRRAEAAEVTTRITVNSTPASATSTRVSVRALNIGNYVNSFTGTPQQGACRSTGALEQELLEAVRSGPS